MGTHESRHAQGHKHHAFEQVSLEGKLLQQFLFIVSETAKVDDASVTRLGGRFGSKTAVGVVKLVCA